MKYLSEIVFNDNQVKAEISEDSICFYKYDKEGGDLIAEYSWPELYDLVTQSKNGGE